MEQTYDQTVANVGVRHVVDMHRGAEWFFWVAALSVINSLVVTFSQTGNMLFGLGGIFTEVLEDVVFRVAPLTKRDALAMLDGIRAAKILGAVRGMPAASFASIEASRNARSSSSRSRSVCLRRITAAMDAVSREMKRIVYSARKATSGSTRAARRAGT